MFKLMPRDKGPFEILERINNNAYKLDLPRDYEVFATFNVANLSSYLEDDTLENLRSNSYQQGEEYGDQGLTRIKSKGVKNVRQILKEGASNQSCCIRISPATGTFLWS